MANLRPQRMIDVLDEYTQIWEVYTWDGRAGKMRTNIEIDDRLMREAMRSSGKRTSGPRSKRASAAGSDTSAGEIRAVAGRPVAGQPARSRLGHVSSSRDVVIVDTTVWIDYLAACKIAEADCLDREVTATAGFDGPDSMRGFARHSR